MVGLCDLQTNRKACMRGQESVEGSAAIPLRRPGTASSDGADHEGADHGRQRQLLLDAKSAVTETSDALQQMEKSQLPDDAFHSFSCQASEETISDATSGKAIL